MISNYETTSKITLSEDDYYGYLVPFLSYYAPGLAALVLAVPDTLAFIEFINLRVWGDNGVNKSASHTLITSSYYALPSINLA